MMRCGARRILACNEKGGDLAALDPAFPDEAIAPER
jgi:hypothetical protein